MLTKYPKIILDANQESQTPLYKILTHPENISEKSEAENQYLEHQINYFSLEFYSTVSLFLGGITLFAKNRLFSKGKGLLESGNNLRKGNKVILGCCFGCLNLIFTVTTKEG